jgi:hypothetical protein
MQSSSSTPTAALMLSGAALLSFLARTFVDYRFVYAELGFDVRTVGFSILLHLALLGSWIWALVAASHARRRGMYVLLAYNVLVAAFGLYTMTKLCPSPCRTGWPVGEITIWSNLLIGLTAALLAAMSVFRQSRAVPS